MSRQPDAPSPKAASAALRVAALMALAAVLYGWLAAHAELISADGLRYVAQARALDQGAASLGVTRAVDHPVYPMAVVAVHRSLGGDTPDSWQAAAQIASVLAGVLLVLPVYLVARDHFGDPAATLAALLWVLLPTTGHVFADTLSESTFLLFWTWGLWGTLRFLRGEVWLGVPVAAAGAGLAYLTRPEGLLLPAALVVTLALSPVWVARGLGRKGLIAVAGLAVALAALIGPYVWAKGGLTGKPSVARLLGTAPRSAAQAVERQRPLDPNQSEASTYVLAVRAVGKAVSDAVTPPLLVLAALGVTAVGLGGDARRRWVLFSVIGAASCLGLVRLHATGGYCTPRHALILAGLLVPAAAAGVVRGAGLLDGLARGWRWVPPARRVAGGATLLVVAGWAPDTLAPVNQGMGVYRDAGAWLAGQGGRGKVVDVTGWSQYYSGLPGYTYENLIAAPGDAEARWVVVREAHLNGPWEYCGRLRTLVDGLTPAAEFQGRARGRGTRVLVFDRQARLSLHHDLTSAPLRR